MSFATNLPNLKSVFECPSNAISPFRITYVLVSMLFDKTLLGSTKYIFATDIQ